jgi:hypothetical protein
LYSADISAALTLAVTMVDQAAECSNEYGVCGRGVLLLIAK